MDTTKGSNNRVVVLSDTVAMGFSYIITTLGDNLSEFSSHDRRLVDKQDNEYFICTKKEHILGMNFDFVKVSPSFYANPDFAEMIETTLLTRLWNR